MKIGDQVNTWGQGKRLQELGIDAKPNYWWGIFQDAKDAQFELSELGFQTGLAGKWYREFVDENKDKPDMHPDFGKVFPAFTVAELGVMLRDRITKVHWASEYWIGYSYDLNHHILQRSSGEHQTHAFGELLINMLSAGEITPAEANANISTP